MLIIAKLECLIRILSHRAGMRLIIFFQVSRIPPSLKIQFLGGEGAHS